MAKAKRVLIVGGGIAGLSAAVALARRGASCEIVEISLTGEPLGAAITFTSRAVEALDELGVLEACIAVMGDTNRMQGAVFLDTAGNPLPGRGPPRRPAQPGLPTAVGLYRPVFSNILREEAARNGVTVRLATSITTLTQDADGVDVTFTDGSTGRYDLVVGADGVRSKVRSLVFGDDVQPQYAGQCSVRWMAEGPPIEGQSNNYYAPFGKMLGYPLPHQNLTYVVTVCDGDPNRHVGPDEARAILAEQLAAFTAPYVVELAKRLHSQSEVIFRPFEWLLVPDPWYRGRVVLTGDAAHATTAHMGMGGGMALEDAVVLAQCVDGEPSMDAALKAFMRRRFERARMVVETSVALCRLEEQSAPPSAVSARSAPVFEALTEPY